MDTLPSVKPTALVTFAVDPATLLEDQQARADANLRAFIAIAQTLPNTMAYVIFEPPDSEEDLIEQYGDVGPVAFAAQVEDTLLERLHGVFRRLYVRNEPGIVAYLAVDAAPEIHARLPQFLEELSTFDLVAATAGGTDLAFLATARQHPDLFAGDATSTIDTIEVIRQNVERTGLRVRWHDQ